ncbi:MAG: hypothetical protein K9K64_03040 [Desulfohalobiaceae bacterium]|nr:hypothetical protein [Desulfohalobiaceae bacterium]
MNADRLLYQSYNIRLQQIEDKELYHKVYQHLLNLKGKSHIENKSKNKKLISLQKKRTSKMMQKLPKIIEKGYNKGRTQSCKAIFTIGITHAKDIIGYIKENSIAEYHADQEISSQGQELNLIEKGYQVTLIMPKAMLEGANLSGSI